MTQHNRIVAVTGLGAINSAGNNVDEYWQAVSEGRREGIITSEREWLLEHTPEAYRKKLRSSLVARIKVDDLVACLLSLNKPAYEHIDERYANRYLSESAVLGAIAAAEALEMAEAEGQVDPKRFGFMVGTGIGGGIEIANFQTIFEEGGSLPPTGMPKTQPENAMIQLVMAYGAKGPSQTMTAACSSGNAAIIDAYREIGANRADMMVAGGTEGFNPLVLALFERTGAADTEDDPSGASRAFHKKAGGAIVSLGASFLVLEELEHAKARGANILGLVSGGARSNDAADPTLLTGEGIEDTMNSALAEAGIGPDEYVHVSAHATAAPKGDPTERDAIKRVFDGRKYDPEQIRRRVTAVKAITAHGLGSANGTEAVAAVKTLVEQKQPPSSWLEDGQMIEGMEHMISSPQGDESLQVDAVLSNGMGFGGQNTSVVFRRYK